SIYAPRTSASNDGCTQLVVHSPQRRSSNVRRCVSCTWCSVHVTIAGARETLLVSPAEIDERLWTLCGKCEDLRALSDFMAEGNVIGDFGRFLQNLGRFLQNKVSIRAGNAEIVDTRDPALAMERCWPFSGLALHPHRERRPRNGRIGSLEMQAARQILVVQAQCELDEARNARRGFCVG